MHIHNSAVPEAYEAVLGEILFKAVGSDYWNQARVLPTPVLHVLRIQIYDDVIIATTANGTIFTLGGVE